MESGRKICNKCKAVINNAQHDPIHIYCNACYEFIRLAIYSDGQKNYSSYLSLYTKNKALRSHTDYAYMES